MKLEVLRNKAGFIFIPQFGVCLTLGCRRIIFDFGIEIEQTEKQGRVLNFLLMNYEQGFFRIFSKEINAYLQREYDLQSDDEDGRDNKTELSKLFKGHPLNDRLIKNSGPGQNSFYYLDFNLSIKDFEKFFGHKKITIHPTPIQFQSPDEFERGLHNGE